MPHLPPILKRSSAIGSRATPRNGTDPRHQHHFKRTAWEPIEDILRHARAAHGDVEIALSAVSVVELTHGIYRARTCADRARRRVFAEGVFHDFIVHPVTLEIAQLAGRIEGEQAAQGNSIALQDLLN